MRGRPPWSFVGNSTMRCSGCRLSARVVSPVEARTYLFLFPGAATPSGSARRSSARLSSSAVLTPRARICSRQRRQVTKAKAIVHRHLTRSGLRQRGERVRSSRKCVIVRSYGDGLRAGEGPRCGARPVDHPDGLGCQPWRLPGIAPPRCPTPLRRLAALWRLSWRAGFEAVDAD